LVRGCTVRIVPHPAAVNSGAIILRRDQAAMGRIVRHQGGVASGGTVQRRVEASTVKIARHPRVVNSEKTLLAVSAKTDRGRKQANSEKSVRPRLYRNSGKRHRLFLLTNPTPEQVQEHQVRLKLFASTGI
jgi:hypothetical protein